MNHQLGIVRYFICTFAALTIAGCTDANPTVSALKTIENFELKSPQIVTSSLNSISVQATCSVFITDVDVSFDNGSTWMTALTYDSATNFSCSTNKSFQMTLSNSKAPWSGMTVTAGQTLNVKYRARTRTNTYVTKDLQVLYNPGLSISQETLVGGRISQTGTGLQLRSRVRFQEQEIATGSGMILRGRILQ